VCPLLQLGLPDRFIDHGEQGALLASVGLDAVGIEHSVRARFAAELA
jgi:1-deoxy-D-xylulose-5-phosphate synthase